MYIWTINFIAYSCMCSCTLEITPPFQSINVATYGVEKVTGQKVSIVNWSQIHIPCSADNCTVLYIDTFQRKTQLFDNLHQASE